MKTLIFPFGNKESLAYARNADERGEEWLRFSPNTELPTIHDQLFSKVFMEVVRKEVVTHLFCPVASVHKFMETFPHGLVLLGESPIQRAMREHRELMRRAATLHPSAPGLSMIELAGVLKAAGNIYGESNDEKIAAMLGVFADASDGEVIEIGCLAGRTAFVLRWIARRQHRFLLTVDPWSSIAGIQHDSPPLLTAMTDEWDWSAVAEMFAVNLVSVGQPVHLRRSSSEAYAVYVAEDPDGRVAVLHIDGNHDYAVVKQDITMWRSHIVEGGWLILDDYRWSHGDGPYRAGNELLAENQHSRVFEKGGALFVKFK